MDAIAAHIVELVRANPNPNGPPLFVAVQGPQGSGKSYISARLKSLLSTQPFALNVALLSIDDLYLPHSDLLSLADKHPDNPLWQGRGQPGTHDVHLGLRVLHALRSQSEAVELPQFDKSLFDGQGDRLPMGLQDRIIVEPPVHIVILEGWCVGFCPISQHELDGRWDGVWAEEKEKLGLPNTIRKANLELVNEILRSYVEMWSNFDLFVQIKPAPSQPLPSQYSIIYQWRQEQEHNMKASNGGRGMSDKDVIAFVNRYIPGYVFFGDIPPVSQPWRAGKGIRLYIDENRCPVELEKF